MPSIIINTTISIKEKIFVFRDDKMQEVDFIAMDNDGGLLFFLKSIENEKEKPMLNADLEKLRIDRVIHNAKNISEDAKHRLQKAIDNTKAKQI